MAIVKKSELFKKIERDYKKIDKFNNDCIKFLSPEDRRSILNECVPKIRKMLMPIIKEIRSKLSYIPGYDLIEYAIKQLREAALESLNLFYEALTSRNIRAPKMNDYGIFILALSCAFCNDVWKFIFMGTLVISGTLRPSPEVELVAEFFVITMVAPVIEEAAKSVALEKGVGYRYTFGFASFEFVNYVIMYAPKDGVGNIVMVRAIVWLFHFFTLVVQDIIPDKTFSFFLAVLCHMAWNAGVGHIVTSPLRPKHNIRRELPWR